MTNKVKTITLAAIAKELKISSKTARAKARKGAFGRRKAPWVFPVTEKRKVVAALKA